MADPRKTLAFDGIDSDDLVTMTADNSEITYDKTQPGGSAVVGRAVALVGSTSDNIVTLADDGAVIYGKLISVEADLCCVVQYGGFATLPGGNGASLTIGGKILGALNASSAKGFIKAASETVSSGPTQGEVQTLWKAMKSRGMIINNDTTTAVVVDLER